MLQGRSFKKMSQIFSLVLFIFLSQCSKNEESKFPKDVRGWGKAEWGMTEKEILEAFKDEGVYIQKGESIDKSYETFYIDDFLVDNKHFSIVFIMDKNRKLNEVVIGKAFVQKISARPEEMRDYFYEDLFKRIEDNLIIKYGKPAHHKEDRKPDEKQDYGITKGRIELEAVWVFPSTEIKLTYLASFLPPTHSGVVNPNIPAYSHLNIHYRNQKSLRDKL